MVTLLVRVTVLLTVFISLRVHGLWGICRQQDVQKSYGNIKIHQSLSWQLFKNC